MANDIDICLLMYFKREYKNLPAGLTGKGKIAVMQAVEATIRSTPSCQEITDRAVKYLVNNESLSTEGAYQAISLALCEWEVMSSRRR